MFWAANGNNAGAPSNGGLVAFRRKVAALWSQSCQFIAAKTRKRDRRIKSYNRKFIWDHNSRQSWHPRDAESHSTICFGMMNIGGCQELKLTQFPSPPDYGNLFPEPKSNFDATAAAAFKNTQQQMRPRRKSGATKRSRPEKARSTANSGGDAVFGRGARGYVTRRCSAFPLRDW